MQGKPKQIVISPCFLLVFYSASNLLMYSIFSKRQNWQVLSNVYNQIFESKLFFSPPGLKYLTSNLVQWDICHFCLLYRQEPQNHDRKQKLLWNLKRLQELLLKNYLTWNIISTPWRRKTSRTLKTRKRGNLAEKRVKNHWLAYMWVSSPIS